MIGEWKGKWALVTGASAGIGKALAEQLALGETNLVLTARRRERLELLAQQLRAKHKIQTEIIVADLTQPSAPKEIFDFTKGKSLAINLLVNNAGFGQYGELHEVEVERLLEMVQVNCSAVLHLTRLYLPGMVAKRSGDVLIVASTASFQAVPYISRALAAGKSYVISGLGNYLGAHGERLVPRRFVTRIAAKLFRPADKNR